MSLMFMSEQYLVGRQHSLKDIPIISIVFIVLPAILFHQGLSFTFCAISIP